MHTEEDDSAEILAEVDVAMGEGCHKPEEGGHRGSSKRPASYYKTICVLLRTGEGDLVLCDNMDEQPVDLARAPM